MPSFVQWIKDLRWVHWFIKCNIGRPTQLKNVNAIMSKVRKNSGKKI